MKLRKVYPKYSVADAIPKLAEALHIVAQKGNYRNFDEENSPQVEIKLMIDYMPDSAEIPYLGSVLKKSDLRNPRDILDVIEDFAKKSKYKEDTLIFYFTGHGINFDGTPNLVLSGADSKNHSN